MRKSPHERDESFYKNRSREVICSFLHIGRMSAAACEQVNEPSPDPNLTLDSQIYLMHKIHITINIFLLFIKHLSMKFSCICPNEPEHCMTKKMFLLGQK